MTGVAPNPRLRVLAVSENGYSHVNKEIAFAHGMQNTMFGLGDPQMHNNKSSPYFLGGYFPDNQPATYFKPALIQSKYKQLYYTPSKRLPLFQAVFHDSVITTNHWLLDNLKLQNIQSDAELLQMLYNVPPMVHLNLATSDTRIQYLLRIDAFFRPLHERLAFQSLIDFEWLSNDRMVQATKFQDGTKLIANFGDQSYGLSSGYGRSQTCDFADQTCVEPHSIVALLKNGEVLRYKSGSIPTL
ncbi:hypothetical protein K7432_016147 [Basidiobolus ranarum]|uniref:Uncharacterized protein n=1 Tax=Basidiobolus ranarum TaxID=34480 RepID=A0ABR2VM40_9FUNG